MPSYCEQDDLHPKCEQACRSIFDLVRNSMKDEAVNQQDRTLLRYLNPEF